MRYLGYANEITESWLKVMYQFWGKAAGNRINHQADLVATVYSAADALDKGIKQYRHSEFKSQQAKVGDAIAMALATGIFQFGASVNIPKQVVRVIRLGLAETVAQSPQTIQRIQRFLLPLFAKHPALQRKFLSPKMIALLIPAIGSSAIIPVIVQPIDKMMKMISEAFYQSVRIVVLKPLDYLETSKQDRA